MKKVLVLCLTVVMIATMCVTAFAKGMFVKSPSKNEAPVIEKVEKEDDDCTADLVITPFGDRDKLPEEKKDILETIYDAIVNIDKDDNKNDAGDVLNEVVVTVKKEIKEIIKQVAQEKKIEEKVIAVSDLFDVTEHGCDGNHEDHKGFTVKLKAQTLKNFISLLHYENGHWEIVKDVTVNKDGTITFKGETTGSYAVLVDSSKLPSDTGDNSSIALWVMLLSASALAIVLVVLNKKRA